MGAPLKPCLCIPASWGMGCWREGMDWKELDWLQARPTAVASLPSRRSPRFAAALLPFWVMARCRSIVSGKEDYFPSPRLPSMQTSPTV